LRGHNRIATQHDWSLIPTFPQPIRSATKRPLGNWIAGERRHEKAGAGSLEKQRGASAVLLLARDDKALLALIDSLTPLLVATTPAAADLTEEAVRASSSAATLLNVPGRSCCEGRPEPAAGRFGVGQQRTVARQLRRGRFRMPHKSTRLLVGVGVVVLLLRPSTVWAQAGPLAIAMSHTGNFTVGVKGVYTIVVSNIGGTASSGQIQVNDAFYDGRTDLPFTFVSAVGTGWSCSYVIGLPSEGVLCLTSSVIAPGGSAPPIALTVIPTISKTVTNTVYVGGASASDSTIIVAAVPTLPEWAMMALAVLLALAGVTALRRRTA
jgi:hypothetical protein